MTQTYNKELPIRNTSSFNLIIELNKVRIPIPFNEVIKIRCFKNEVTKLMSFYSDLPSNTDTISVHEETPKIFIGPHLEK